MPIYSLFFLLMTAFFMVALFQVHLFEIAFVKLGLSPEISLLLLMGTLVGSGINLPIYSAPTRESSHFIILPNQKRVLEIFQPVREDRMTIAVNAGGCLIPLGLCLYFISLQLINPVHILMCVAVISALSYQFSSLIPGIGVGMPIFLAPCSSAIVALVMDPEHAAQLAYISGVLGVLIGADLLRLKDITSCGAPVASIGGAGTFDGIFMTGIIAALLA